MNVKSSVSAAGMTRVSGAAAKQHSLNFAIDLPLLFSVITLTAFGLIMVYSASQRTTAQMEKDMTYLLNRQIIWVLLASVVALVLSRINYHFYQKLLLFMMGGTALGLVAVLFFGSDELGSTRSLFGGSVRPSELAKMSIIIYLSFWLVSKKDQLNTFSFGLAPIMVILGVTGGLILLQPDISATATVIVLGALMFFLAGGEIRQLVPIIVIALLLGWLVVLVYKTGYNRLLEFVSGLLNPENASYHVRRSLGAIINGGVFGMGIGLGTTKWSGLPVAPTDSIFAVVAEETGLIGALGMIGLFGILLWRGLKIASQAPDMQGRLLAAGLTMWITMEALINMCVMVNLLPFAGNALPFISYSGSSLLMTYASIGILMNISRQGVNKQETTQGRSNRAVVDLRGRNSGRGVSRAVRPSSTRE